MTTWRTWRDATRSALYGPGGFFRTSAPADHFRTSPIVSDAFGTAILRLAEDAGLRRVIDVGAGRGELLTALWEADPGLDLVAVELAPRPPELPGAIEWADDPPDDCSGLVIANEWLDNVGVDVVEVDDHGSIRVVEVAVDGARPGSERLGPPVDGADARWLDAWWPLAGASPGTRAEVGHTRDHAWAGLVRRVRDGVLIAIDYGHVADGRPPTGTLTGYRGGRTVRPRPDGSTDITAHVAMDALQAAGERAGAVTVARTTQADALRELGVDARRPPLALAGTDPTAYLRALNRAGTASELLDPNGLGGFFWLRQAVSSGPF